jgi:hypothetical protein
MNKVTKLDEYKFNFDGGTEEVKDGPLSKMFKEEKLVQPKKKMKELFDDTAEVATTPENAGGVNTEVLYKLLVRYAKARGISGMRAYELVDRITGIFYGFCDSKYPTRDRIIFGKIIELMNTKLGR